MSWLKHSIAQAEVVGDDVRQHGYQMLETLGVMDHQWKRYTRTQMMYFRGQEDNRHGLGLGPLRWPWEDPHYRLRMEQTTPLYRKDVTLGNARLGQSFERTMPKHLKEQSDLEKLAKIYRQGGRTYVLTSFGAAFGGGMFIG